MEEVISFFKENPVQFLSTVGLDNKPKVRPFQFMLAQDNKLYFCTSSQKDVYKELEKNPYIQLSACSSAFAWIRLSGKVVFDNNIDIKNKIIETNDLVRNIYKTGDNPIFEIFYLENAEAAIADFSGNEPKIFTI